MDINYLKKLVKLMDESSLTELEIKEENVQVRLSKKIKQVVAQTASHQVAIMPSSAAVKAAEPEKSTPKETKADNKVHEVKSPIVGTFYRAPAPDADVYVKVGDSVSAGTVLCIVEAMKLMNEIECDVSGKILKVLVENGKPVEYNQPLFLIELA